MGTTYLCGLGLDSVQDGLERRLAVPAIDASLLVVLESGAHTLRAEVKRIAERLMDGLNTVPAGHKYLFPADSSEEVLDHLFVVNLPARRLLSKLEGELP
jgi:hypothetical protein